LSSAIGVTLALSTFLIREVPVDESGAKTRVTGFSSRYYLWLSAHTITFLESLVLFLDSRGKRVPPLIKTP
jgi:hypothetical protein